MARAARPRSSADVWHSLTNASQSARAAVSVTGGSGPAPMEIGSTRAAIGASDALPGPQVPPAAGAGRATSNPEMANPTPKRPTRAKLSLIQN